VVFYAIMAKNWGVLITRTSNRVHVYDIGGSERVVCIAVVLGRSEPGASGKWLVVFGKSALSLFAMHCVR